MSGILGAWNSQKPIPWQKMLDDLTVLGRDGKGDWHNREIGLSLGRTQFFNTPESCQETPVIEYEGSVLVWDGRIDDRESLLGGRSHVTDAQLIIEAYRRWGVDCLQHLTGEYVFILWDASNDLLLVGCDVVGGRTIAYYWDGETLLLSSRVVTLLLHPQVSKEFDEIYLAHTICNLWSHPPGITAFADIKRLRPGFALILKSGQLQERQVTQLPIPEHYELPKSPEILYEKFWDLLNQATKDRLRSHRPVCTTISGGLDSTTVTVSLLNHLPKIDAFSNVTTIFPEFDERKPIQSFLERYPQVQWHDVNCDRAVALTEPWEKLPIPDDPLISCTLPMDLQLMEKMQHKGFNIVFDGVWGDHLFYNSLQDLVKANCWQQSWEYIKGKKNIHSILLRELFLPQSPKWLQQKCFARWQKKRAITFPWIRSEYIDKTTTKIAIQQDISASSFPDSNAQFIISSLQSGYSVAAMQVYKFLKNCHQLQPVSPFQDQRLIEFATNIHPSLQYHIFHNKIFLRKANLKTLPEDVLWRPKDNFFDPLMYAGLGKGDEVISLAKEIDEYSFLQDIIHVDYFKDNLNNFRVNYSTKHQKGEIFQQSISSSMYRIFSLFNWYKLIIKIR
ncbi:asparagine synthase-related protein [Calothrix sp. PCC 6303]|uniref:asparagine synthase-related protein n=1 Tax=Calothrix sp. PCC 6303 TaxID=1170562 RepID=UPI0002A013E8|nr:asparagine synthase-related protein [Calothrix sp. PCC 6303]AFY99916.1 asparagine synthase [Calothrix sp. PCC 6303]